MSRLVSSLLIGCIVPVWQRFISLCLMPDPADCERAAQELRLANPNLTDAERARIAAIN